MRIIIIGGGLVGLGTALELLRLKPGIRVAVLEKEPEVGQHQSTHNSGVLHAGLYYKPGSMKARLAVTGIRRMVAFCKENDIRHDVCGKVVVATVPEEVPRLRTLIERGRQNGLQRLQWLGPEQLRELEPYAAGVAAVHVPEEGIVDFAGVCRAMRIKIEQAGAEVLTGAEALSIKRQGGDWRVETPRGGLAGDFLVNCAGLHSDRVAGLAGEKPDTRIIPFRGEYYKLRPQAGHLVRNLIYPVPDPVFPFLGVHFTRLIDGGVEAGPNAVLALAREGYSKWRINPIDAFGAMAFPGLWRFVAQHRRMAWEEVRRSCSKKWFCSSLQKLVPEITEADLETGGAGVRAQAMQPDGTLVQDFQLVEGPGSIHVLNAPSPAATASLAIGEHIARRVLNR
ncbi:MAG: L-2-hydroxyglutarate oxidase [Opitutaceae bacterium]|nr:L-2-hydroxyglutarate oxidase [Opitutaceae bacterium]